MIRRSDAVASWSSAPGTEGKTRVGVSVVAVVGSRVLLVPEAQTP